MDSFRKTTTGDSIAKGVSVPGVTGENYSVSTGVLEGHPRPHLDFAEQKNGVAILAAPFGFVLLIFTVN